MKIFPWDDVLKKVNDHIAHGANCYQQFNCEKCGAKQTMETPNTFHVTGQCEECKHVTDIKKNGMNFMIHMNLGRSNGVRS